jgi:murein DD-endopeptidase MepM/ murein hydrolase activator NlpD
LRKRFYIIFVARNADGHLQKVPIPIQYAYVFIAAAVIGLFTITGIAGSYSRMLLKTARFNQVRTEHEALRRDYKHLEQVAQQKDIETASLSSLASEVTAYYGLKQKTGPKTAETRAAAEAQSPVVSDSTEESYTRSLDQLYALRASALAGVATQGVRFHLGEATSTADWSALADAPSLWPVEGRVTSSFGERLDPFNGEGAFHAGIDIATAFGSPVYATAPGTVLQAEASSGYGREIVIDHGHGLTTVYGHLSGFAVVAGQQVNTGDVIGYVGMSGRSTGPHLHYEVRINNQPVNPHKYLRATLEHFSLGGE